VVYESPFRLNKLLTDIEKIYGEKTEVSVCREMTKKFEEVQTGDLVKIRAEFGKRKIKGEVVVVFI
jgi:16S rRNA (cytidine1402-2'-O)-methyltransferase